ncbi:hypothetical protein [Chitinimonas lacunae]|uniref:Uncharacterized protein n=1 Tax=Chitinimonas lacunae TaxID=1963018 RepID=A0ABV8MN30_9NEIS
MSAMPYRHHPGRRLRRLLLGWILLSVPLSWLIGWHDVPHWGLSALLGGWLVLRLETLYLLWLERRGLRRPLTAAPVQIREGV